MIKVLLFFVSSSFLLLSCAEMVNEQESDDALQGYKRNDLTYDYLPQVWDEGIPLGNGHIGALVWEKEGKLRLSLDNVNLWDLRKMENLEREEWKYSWVVDRWESNEYQKVQQLFDEPYDRLPAPSKIPGGALEFSTEGFGKVRSSSLSLGEATCKVEWDSGATLTTFVHAEEPMGWFQFQGIDANHFKPELIIPAYNLEGKSQENNPVTGQDLRRLGYPKGEIIKQQSSIVYTQPGWEDFEYQITVRWEETPSGIEGCWSITTNMTTEAEAVSSAGFSEYSFKKGFQDAFTSHVSWWERYWSKSSINVPDPVLEKQWYLEQYKFGATARVDAPPISLQAVWTADNGKLPPWKGDYHHDLNTQLSYWPCYTSNHLDLGEGYLNWLWDNYPTFVKYTKAYFGTKGLNVPGVTTLTGEPMGGWIQYAFGPTVSGWLAQHFYLHWRYTMDRDFLEEKAYPWFREVAIYLDEVSETGEGGYRKLPISSSPEFHDNSREAWFGSTTNFDLAIIRFVYAKAEELALELGKKDEAAKWKALLSQWPDLAVDGKTGLMVAPGEPYSVSHRHFSHLMAIHPLGLINWSDGEKERAIIRNTIENLQKQGTSAWVGYSFSWLGNLQARMLDGEGAAETLRIFATSFCLPNSFHVNGDQSGKGYSNATYRPFTLEGNFAFAAGLQEMLLQSHEGFIRLFPAIPDDWEKASFVGFRAQGGVSVSASIKKDTVVETTLQSEKDVVVRLMNPFDGDCWVEGVHLYDGEIYERTIKKGEKARLSFKNSR